MTSKSTTTARGPSTNDVAREQARRKYSRKTQRKKNTKPELRLVHDNTTPVPIQSIEKKMNDVPNDIETTETNDVHAALMTGTTHHPTNGDTIHPTKKQTKKKRSYRTMALASSSDDALSISQSSPNHKKKNQRIDSSSNNENWICSRCEYPENLGNKRRCVLCHVRRPVLGVVPPPPSNIEMMTTTKTTTTKKNSVQGILPGSTVASNALFNTAAPAQSLLLLEEHTNHSSPAASNRQNENAIDLDANHVPPPAMDKNIPNHRALSHGRSTRLATASLFASRRRRRFGENRTKKEDASDDLPTKASADAPSSFILSNVVIPPSREQPTQKEEPQENENPNTESIFPSAAKREPRGETIIELHHVDEKGPQPLHHDSSLLSGNDSMVPLSMQQRQQLVSWIQMQHDLLLQQRQHILQVQRQHNLLLKQTRYIRNWIQTWNTNQTHVQPTSSSSMEDPNNNSELLLTFNPNTETFGIDKTRKKDIKTTNQANTTSRFDNHENKYQASVPLEGHPSLTKDTPMTVRKPKSAVPTKMTTTTPTSHRSTATTATTSIFSCLSDSSPSLPASDDEDSNESGRPKSPCLPSGTDAPALADYGEMTDSQAEAFVEEKIRSQMLMNSKKDALHSESSLAVKLLDGTTFEATDDKKNWDGNAFDSSHASTASPVADQLERSNTQNSTQTIDLSLFTKNLSAIANVKNQQLSDYDDDNVNQSFTNRRLSVALAVDSNILDSSHPTIASPEADTLEWSNTQKSTQTIDPNLFSKNLSVNNQRFNDNGANESFTKSTLQPVVPYESQTTKDRSRAKATTSPKLPDDDRSVPVGETRKMKVALANSKDSEKDSGSTTAAAIAAPKPAWINNKHARRFMRELKASPAIKTNDRSSSSNTQSVDRPGTTDQDAKTRVLPCDKENLWDDDNSQEPDFAYQETVRCKHLRERLPCHDCPNCRKFFEALRKTGHDVHDFAGGGIPPLTGNNHVIFSRHRARYARNETPEDFWELDFIDERKLPNERRLSFP
jgi:hypothetical protein